MKSYFEIAGDLIELVHQTTPPSPEFDAFVAARPERGRLPQKSSAPQSGRGKAEEAESRPGLFEHAYKTGMHPINEFLNLPRGRQIGYLQKPYVFALWGVQKQIEVIEMHYDYFIG